MTRRLEAARRDGEAGQAIVVMIGAILPAVVMVATIVDVTRNRAEEAQRAGWEHRYTVAAESGGLAFYNWDARTNRIEFRGATQAVTGRSVTEMTGDLTGYLDLVRQEDRTTIDGELVRRLDALRPYVLFPQPAAHSTTTPWEGNR